MITEEDIRRMSEDQDPNVLTFNYRNYKGRTGVRTVAIQSIVWTSTPYHPEPQYIIEGYDMDKKVFRQFALKDCCFMGR